jgi:3-methyladenine DNA glycosylase AlkD
MTAEEVELALQNHASETDAIFLQRFFKTGKGQYGEGDVFIGIRMPQLRLVCRQFSALPLKEVQKLLNSPVHEHRLAALVILTLQYARGTEQQKHSIYDLYLVNVRKSRINNWDLVDASAGYIVGEYLLNRPRKVLFELAASDNVWQRRVAMLSSFAFIKRGDPTTSLKLAEVLLHDEHDLIQKAVGWLLREVGKRCGRAYLLSFLDQHAHEMPRTMLRYSLEHLTPEQKTYYMNLKSGN